MFVCILFIHSFISFDKVQQSVQLVGSKMNKQYYIFFFSFFFLLIRYLIVRLSFIILDMNNIMKCKIARFIKNIYIYNILKKKNYSRYQLTTHFIYSFWLMNLSNLDEMKIKENLIENKTINSAVVLFQNKFFYNVTSFSHSPSLSS